MLLLAAGIPVQAKEPNTLTRQETKAGWQLLFDGKSGAGWRGIKKDGFPQQGWVIEDGTLRKVAGVKGGDLISAERYREFDLRWEWKVPPGANNGLKYFIIEERGGIGHEYQMIDDATAPEAKHKTASFYDVLPPDAKKPLKKPGQWNQSRVLVRGNQVEHWLNGRKVLAYELGSDAVKQAVAKSKFKDVPGFGTSVAGHLLLTDHNDEASFRSIKLLNLAKGK